MTLVMSLPSVLALRRKPPKISDHLKSLVLLLQRARRVFGLALTC
jgi:hypothetical protein